MSALKIEVPDGFDFKTTLESHGWVQLAPFSYAEDLSRLDRIQRLADGTIVEMSIGVASRSLEVRWMGRSGRLRTEQKSELEAITRRIFSLDQDLTPFYALLDDHPGYAWVRRKGAGRLLRSPTVWEDLVKTLFTTNTTWAGTRNMVQRAVDLGAQGPDGIRTFPSPERIASIDEDELAEHLRAGYRTQYLHDLARRIASGELDVESWDRVTTTSDDLHAAITDLNGFGPYAASVMLKLLGHFDRLTIDTESRTMFAEKYNEGRPPKEADIRRHYERYGEWQGLVMWMDLMH